MIPKSCPFSDKKKLNLVLHGERNCQGHQEKNAKGMYERCKDCEACPFFDTSLLVMPWTYVPYTPPPQPQPLQPGITTTTPNTAGQYPWMTVTWQPYTTTDNTSGLSTSGNNTGNYTNNAGNYTYLMPLKNRYGVSSLISNTFAGNNLLYSSVV